MTPLPNANCVGDKGNLREMQFDATGPRKKVRKERERLWERTRRWS